jgi:hypothetical protein
MSSLWLDMAPPQSEGPGHLIERYPDLDDHTAVFLYIHYFSHGVPAFAIAKTSCQSS